MVSSHNTCSSHTNSFCSAGVRKKISEDFPSRFSLNRKTCFCHIHKKLKALVSLHLPNARHPYITGDAIQWHLQNPWQFGRCNRNHDRPSSFWTVPWHQLQQPKAAQAAFIRHSHWAFALKPKNIFCGKWMTIHNPAIFRLSMLNSIQSQWLLSEQKTHRKRKIKK